MNPHDPRYPSGFGGNPHAPQQQPYGVGTVQAQAPAQGPYGAPPQAYPQGGGYPGANPGQPQGGYAGQQGYAQGPQGPYPQGAPQAQPQPSTPKKGGVGKVIAILAAVSVLLVGALIGLSVINSLSDDDDNSEVLRIQAQTILDAVKTDDKERLKEPLIKILIEPNRAHDWFADTYGAARGEKLSEEWNREIFGDLPGLLRPFKEAVDVKKTVVRVDRITRSTPKLDASQQSVLKTQQKPRALYIVTFVQPGEKSSPWDMYYFGIVGGRFGYLGKMYPAHQ
jgi:hypothetical protein